MKWTQEKPTKAGMYIRNNPPASARVVQIIHDFDGNLRVDCEAGWVDLPNIDGQWWWFGPIPELTDRQLERRLD